ncbi:MAG: L-ribulose-5-phosphate 4-epimerase [Candidatus Aminicenantales bacterium]
MLESLKEHVWQANLDLVRYSLVILTFGNASGIDRERGIVAIKPSGVSYDDMKPGDMVLVDLDGKTVEGTLNPSSDTPTHVELYKSFPDVGGIVHAHSEYATMFAQAAREIPCLGTTHADHFHGPVPVTRFLSKKEVEADYEGHTGRLIADRFSSLVPLEVPAVLVAGHGPFAWGKSPEDAARNALVLEKTAKMALGSLILDPRKDRLPDYILNKHYMRKHGPNAYYGQKKRGA